MVAIVNPLTGKAVLRTIIAVGKLGAIAAISILANQTFRASADLVVSNAMADFRKAKFVLAGGKA